MGTLTAGIKEIFSSAKTTGTNVMLCGNDGTPDGHMTMANLANVLGGIAKENTSDFNTMKDWGTWRILDTQNIQNAPSGVSGSGFMLVGGWIYQGALRSIQLLLIQDNSVHIRCFNGSLWGGWRDL